MLECSIAKLLVSTLDASFTAALLLWEDGIVIHKNSAASILLETNDICEDVHISKWLEPASENMTWTEEFENLKKNVPASLLCHLTKANRNVSVNMAMLDSCPCCQRTYVSLYAKPEASSVPVDKHSALQLDKDIVGASCVDEKQVRHQEYLLQSVINASFDPMFQIDEKGYICMVNDAAVSLFGYSRDEFLGNNVSMICGLDHADKHNSYLERYVMTGENHIVGRKRTVQARRKDGSEFEVELGVQEIILENGERMFCGYLRDITSQRLFQRALRKKEAEIKGEFFKARQSQTP